MINSQSNNYLAQSVSIVDTCRAYYQLTKPKVILLLLLTAIVGMSLATPNAPVLSQVVIACLGIGLMASAGAVFNHCIDHNIDRKMARTKRRPIPQGKVSLNHALIFASILAVLGMLILWYFINPLTD